MFQVSERATEKIKEYFKDREEIPTIRITLTQAGWSGPSLGLALDEPQEDDEVFNQGGITYTINKKLYEQINPISVDYVETPRGSGYQITANIAKLGQGCRSCSC